MAAKAVTIEVPKIDLHLLEVEIKGRTPLICNRFLAETLDDIEAGNENKPKPPRKTKTAAEKVQDALYIRGDRTGKKLQYAFPAQAFLSAMAEAATFGKGLFKKKVTGTIRIESPDGLLLLKTSTPEVRRDRIVMQKTGGAQIATRPTFQQWSVVLPIQYDASKMSKEHIVALLQRAGFSVGVGCWRPECGGSFGTFEVTGNLKEFS